MQRNVALFLNSPETCLKFPAAKVRYALDNLYL